MLDAKSLELAKSANKMVFVEGTVAEQNGEKWVTVTSFISNTGCVLATSTSGEYGLF